MEAMACGVPVVTTRLSGIPELVRDGETGWLAEPADAASLARRLRELLAASPEEVLSRVAAGRRLVEREFTLAEEGRRMAELFQPRAGRKTSWSSSSVPSTGPKRSSR